MNFHRLYLLLINQ